MLLTIIVIISCVLVGLVLALVGLNLWLLKTESGKRAALRIGLRIAKFVQRFPRAQAWLNARAQRTGNAGHGNGRSPRMRTPGAPGAAGGVSAMLESLTPEMREMLASKDVDEIVEMTEAMGVTLGRDEKRQLVRVKGAVSGNSARDAQRRKEIAKRRAARKRHR